MATQTTNYSLYLPTVNGDENTWGTFINYNSQRLDVELNNLDQRVDGVASNIASLNSTLSNVSANVSTLSSSFNALQQDDSAQDSSITSLGDRISQAELAISTLQSTGGSGGGSEVSLTNGSVVTAYIAFRAVTDEKLAEDSVTAFAIETAAVTSDAIANNAVAGRHIQADAVGTSQIADDAVIGTHIADDQIQPQHIVGTHVLAPVPTAADGDKVLYNDNNYGLRWKRQNKVTRITRYTDLFVNTSDIEPGDLFVITNGGDSGGSGTYDYPVSVSGVATPNSIDANSVFLANTSSPSSPSDWTTLYIGANGVVDVDTNDPLRAVFELADGTSYTVPLPSFSINAETEITGANIAGNDYAMVHDRSNNVQRKIQLQELGIAMGWGSVVIEGDGGGGGLVNSFGIITGFEVDPVSGSLIMNSTGGFSSQTAFINTDGDFILTG